MDEKSYHHENLREKLIEAGIHLMNEEGFAHLSLRKIAAHCGASHTAPYRHFKDKESLLAAMQQHVEGRFYEILRAAVKSDDDSVYSMVEFGKAYVLFFVENPQYYTFFTSQKSIYVNFSEQMDKVESNYLPFNLFKEEAIRHLDAQGVPKSQYLAALASAWATVHGLAGMATMSGVHYSGDWGVLTETILKGVPAHE